MTTISLPTFADGHLTTHSSESCFRACPRRYALKYVHGLRPAHASEPLRMGSAFHVGLEAVKAGGSEKDAERAVRAAYADAECPPYLEAEQFQVEEEKAAAMARAWARRYAADRITVYVAVELSFDLPLLNPRTGRPHPTYRNAGKIDGIAELPDGRLALVEHKTSAGTGWPPTRSATPSPRWSTTPRRNPPSNRRRSRSWTGTGRRPRSTISSLRFPASAPSGRRRGCTGLVCWPT